MSKIVTANRLSTGTVIFLGADGEWVSAVEDARLFPDAATAEEGLDIGRRDAERAIVVDPFVTDKNPAAEGQSGMTLRDSIRAFGPTISFGPDAKVA